MRRQVLAMLAIPVLAASMLAGCGGDDDSASDSIAERIIEEQAGEDVDVDLDSQGGVVSIKGKDGGEFTSGQGLPEGWPEDVPMPADIVEINGTVMAAERGKQLMVSANVEQEIAGVQQHFDEVFDDWTQEVSSAAKDPNAPSGMSMWSKGDRTAILTSTEGDNGDTSIVVSLMPRTP